MLTLAGIGLAGGSGRATSSPVASPATFGAAAPDAAAATPSPARLPTAAARAPSSPPAQLVLATVNVQAPVEQVVTTSGVLGVPDNPGYVGWWTGSARPGAPVGSVVIDGHVDSATRGIGALFHLTQLRTGDLVTVVATDRTRWTYRVYARQSYTKQQALPAGLFAATGPARLVMITCGGAFNTTTRHYEDNVVVLAGPV
jgi:hypothetical protein